MALKCCWSSRQTSSLLEWRNPQGKEELWVGREQARPCTLAHLGKMVVTEVGSVIFGTTAAVETVAYSLGFLGSLPWARGNPRIYQDFYKRMQSSLFTVVWNLSNLTFFNLFYVNVPTHESIARSWLYRQPPGDTFRKLISAAVIALFDPFDHRSGRKVAFAGCLGMVLATPQIREEDMQYVCDWSAKLVTAHSNLAADDFYVKEGKVVNFWTQNLQDASAIEAQPKAFEFLMTRCFYKYWGQLRQGQALPEVLGIPIINQLNKIHQDQALNNHYAQLKNYAEDFNAYKNRPPEEDLKISFVKLEKEAAFALQKLDEKFLRFCLKRACRA